MEHSTEQQARGKGHQEHGQDHTGHEEIFRRRFWINLVLAVPVVAYSEMIQHWFGFRPPTFPGSSWIAPVGGTVIFLYGGWAFLTGAVSEIRTRRPGMMLLIGLAITVAFVASVATELGWLNLDFWWELAALIVVMLLGHWQEMKAIGSARGALEALAELLPDTAEKVVNGSTEEVPIDELRSGDVFLVRPGGRVPADGEIVEGTAEVDESMVTGESLPVTKEAGEEVVAGTVVAGSSIRVRVTATGEDTALAGIRRLVEEAQTSRSRAQVLADRAAALLFYVATSAAVVTFIVWTGLGQTGSAVTRTVTVLVISCPHALGLAIPLVIALSTSMGARQGILVTDRLALERMRLVDVVLFDKTGTLTRGQHAVTDVAAAQGDDDDEVLLLAAAAEVDSEHPLARAIVEAARSKGNIPEAKDFRSLAGRGVKARVDGSEVAVGGPAMLRDLGLEPPEALSERTDGWRKQGAAVLHVVRDSDVVGAIAVRDEVRPESKETIDILRRRGVQTSMITGDARSVADAVAGELGIDEVFAEVLPEDKDKAVKQLQDRGLVVAMVGDGVNDAPALARADVGIAIGAGTDVAIQSAGIVLASDDPRAVVSALGLSRAGYRKMVQNLVWAAGYNVVAIPAAAGVFAPWGFVLAPAVGAILMSASTVVVALNAQLLRRVDLSAS